MYSVRTRFFWDICSYMCPVILWFYIAINWKMRTCNTFHFVDNMTIYIYDDGTHIATYIPEEPGPHRVHVRLDGKDIDGKY
jgi:hypothetical protein